MEKLRVLVAIDSLEMGGIQKSLISFMRFFRGRCDFDVIVWHDSGNWQVRLPEYAGRIHVYGAESVRAAFRKYGFFSLDFFISMLGYFRKKRWLAMPRVRKRYDIAIAYSHVGGLKYYVIDNVDARMKYALYHHGAYEFDDITKALDTEYYSRYDRVFAVSEYAKEILSEALPGLRNISVLPNLIDCGRIKALGNEPCPEFASFGGIKLLTVGRLEREKDPLRIIETAKLLCAAQMDFLWVVVGHGGLFERFTKEIDENGLRGRVMPVGNQENPYRYMSRCDIYVQFSLFEADPLTVKEAAVFDKPMILSDILSFRNCRKQIRNIHLCSSNDDFVRLTKAVLDTPVEKNDMQSVCRKAGEEIRRELFDDPFADLSGSARERTP